MVAFEASRPLLDATHQGPVLLIFIPTFLCPAALLVASTIIVRYRSGGTISRTWRSPTLWDFTALSAMLAFTTAWSTIILLQTRTGLGVAEPPEQQHAFEKYEYAADLVYLLAILSWKVFNGMSSAQVFGLVDERQRARSTGLSILYGICFFAIFLACVFQCEGPSFWAIRSQSTSKCFDRVRFWPSVGALDIISDVIIHGRLLWTILKSHMISRQKRAAALAVTLYLLTYMAAASTRVVFVTQSWHRHPYALIAAWTALSTFSQLVFPMSLMCVGKMSKYIDFESYFSSAIGASSRKVAYGAPSNGYVPRNYAKTTTHATGPKTEYADSVEEMPLRDMSGSSRRGESEADGSEISEAIRVKRDVDVRSEYGEMEG